MVKKLDDNEMPELLDHAGWRIWRLAQQWKSEFDAAMVARGHGWFAEARSNLLPLLDREGTPQATVVVRAGMTKQAVQQLIDELVADGIVERRVDADDRRSKYIHFTRKGFRALADANVVKSEIQARYAATLGQKRFAEFMTSLDKLGAAVSPPVEKD